MDLRLDIIQEVIKALKGKATDDVIDIVQDTLTIELDKYEVQERCTDVVVQDTSAEKMLKKFIAKEGDRFELKIATVQLRKICKLSVTMNTWVPKGRGEGLNERKLHSLRAPYSAHAFIASKSYVTAVI